MAWSATLITKLPELIVLELTKLILPATCKLPAITTLELTRVNVLPTDEILSGPTTTLPTRIVLPEIVVPLALMLPVTDNDVSVPTEVMLG